jgi:hypothetical protein
VQDPRTRTARRGRGGTRIRHSAALRRRYLPRLLAGSRVNSPDRIMLSGPAPDPTAPGLTMVPALRGRNPMDHPSFSGYCGNLPPTCHIPGCLSGPALGNPPCLRQRSGMGSRLRVDCPCPLPDQCGMRDQLWRNHIRPSQTRRAPILRSMKPICRSMNRRGAEPNCAPRSPGRLPFAGPTRWWNPPTRKSRTTGRECPESAETVAGLGDSGMRNPVPRVTLCCG